MDYRPLGGSGIFVSQIALGAMMFGVFGNTDHDECVRMVHTALDAGVTLIDTASGYSGGESEEILGEALAGGRREDVVLAVKFGVAFEGDPNHRGGSRRWINRTVEDSLRRLRTDHIDLYQLGAPDPYTDIDETLSALTDLVTAGKIRAFGASKVPASRIVEAHAVGERRGFGRFRTEQCAYSMITRSAEYDLLPTARRMGMGVLAFSPLTGGWLSGRYGTTADSGSSTSWREGRHPGRFDADAPANAAKLAAAQALGTVAAEAGLTLVQLATAWAVRHPAVTATIIGPRTPEHLAGYLAADGIELADDVLDAVDAIVAPGSSVDIADTLWQYGSTTLEAAERRR